MTNKTNEPCADATLIQAQGQQVEHIDVLEYIAKKYNIKGEDGSEHIREAERIS